MHGYALEWLAPHLTPGKKVLDVGCGSGYLTACFAELVRGGGGHAFGIDHIDGLVKLSETNMQRGNPEFLERGEACLSVRDGFEGMPEHAPFDVIHVGAAVRATPTKKAPEAPSLTCAWARAGAPAAEGAGRAARAGGEDGHPRGAGRRQPGDPGGEQGRGRPGVAVVADGRAVHPANHGEEAAGRHALDTQHLYYEQQNPKLSLSRTYPLSSYLKHYSRSS